MSRYRAGQVDYLSVSSAEQSRLQTADAAAHRPGDNDFLRDLSLIDERGEVGVIPMVTTHARARAMAAAAAVLCMQLFSRIVMSRAPSTSA